MSAWSRLGCNISLEYNYIVFLGFIDILNLGSINNVDYFSPSTCYLLEKSIEFECSDLSCSQNKPYIY